jgi:hypothetical protein
MNGAGGAQRERRGRKLVRHVSSGSRQPFATWVPCSPVQKMVRRSQPDPLDEKFNQ